MPTQQTASRVVRRTPPTRRTGRTGRTGRTLMVAAVALGALASLAACGSDTGPANSLGTPTNVNQDPLNGETLAPQSTSPLPAETAVPSSTATYSGALPTVDHPSDLGTEPVVHAGTPPQPGQLVTKDLVVGSGTAATTADTVDVKYVGSIFLTGKVFDASWTRSPTDTSFPLNGVVPGFAQGIAGMKPGGRRLIIIPPALGYGSSGQSAAGIGGTDDIVFVVDLLKIG